MLTIRLRLVGFPDLNSSPFHFLPHLINNRRCSYRFFYCVHLILVYLPCCALSGIERVYPLLGGTEVTYDDTQFKGSAFGKSNVIAPAATVKGDLRYLTYEQCDRAHLRMRKIVAKNLPGTSAKIEFFEFYPPMAPTPGNLNVLKVYSQVSSHAGLGSIDPLPPRQRGAGDVQFVAPFIDSLDGLGATGEGAHSPNENLYLPSIERAMIRTALLIYRLTRQK